MRIHVPPAIRRFLSDEERAGNVVLGAVAASSAICFITSVLAILLMK